MKRALLANNHDTSMLNDLAQSCRYCSFADRLELARSQGVAAHPVDLDRAEHRDLRSKPIGEKE